MSCTTLLSPFIPKVKWRPSDSKPFKMYVMTNKKYCIEAQMKVVRGVFKRISQEIVPIKKCTIGLKFVYPKASQLELETYIEILYGHD